MEKVKPPRAMVVRFPFGCPWGEPDNAAQHRVLIEDALEILRTAHEPGSIASLPYRWKREDYAAILEQRRKWARDQAEKPR